MSFEPAFKDGRIDQQRLTDLYTKLQALCGTFAGDLGSELPHYEAILKRTFYLRHWKNITRNFMQTYGDRVRSGYRAHNASTPDYDGMSRSEALEKIAAYPGSSDDALELLQSFLRDLTPGKIPEEWN